MKQTAGSTEHRTENRAADAVGFRRLRSGVQPQSRTRAAGYDPVTKALPPLANGSGLKSCRGAGVLRRGLGQEWSTDGLPDCSTRQLRGHHCRRLRRSDLETPSGPTRRRWLSLLTFLPPTPAHMRSRLFRRSSATARPDAHRKCSRPHSKPAPRTRSAPAPARRRTKVSIVCEPNRTLISEQSMKSVPGAVATGFPPHDLGSWSVRPGSLPLPVLTSFE